MRIIFSLFIIITIVACSKNQKVLSSKQLQAFIINGSDISESNSISESIVGIVNTKKNTICTGTLIAQNIILTAAHCAPEQNSHLKIVFSNDIDDTMNTLEPDILQEFVLSVSDFKKGPNSSDIALIKFKGSAPAHYKPALFLADKSDLKIGTMITIAGFGVNLVSTQKVDQKIYPNLEDMILRGEIVCDESDKGEKFNCVKISATGDGILRMAQAPISFIEASEVQLDEHLAGTCNGDSGGPAFIKIAGSYYLFGVTSRGSALCNEIGVYTNALAFEQWIKKTSEQLK
jgi:secreted trypsin-like serine protease